MTEPKLMLAKASKLAHCLEMADKNLKPLKGAKSTVHHISHRPSVKPSSSKQQRREQKPCKHCGRNNHLTTQCRFTDVTCHFCKKKGHISTICRAKKAEGRNKSAAHTRYVAENSGEEEFYLHKVAGSSDSPINVVINIKGKPLQMELDTGATFSIISKNTRQQHFADIKV